jgi:hypothetical protein
MQSVNLDVAGGRMAPQGSTSQLYVVYIRVVVNQFTIGPASVAGSYGSGNIG